MGSLCSSPPPAEAKPAPKQGEPEPNPELIQLRNKIDSVRKALKSLLDRKPPLTAKINEIIPKIEANKPIVQQVEARIAPIDQEIQSKLAEDSEAETSVCAERKEELTEIVAVAEGYHEQKTAAKGLLNDMNKALQELEKHQADLTDMTVKAAPYPEELSQVKELLDQDHKLLQDYAPLGSQATTVSQDASVQEEGYAPTRERLYRYAAVEEVVEESAYVEVEEEQAVAAEIIDEFTAPGEFFDEGTYSGWLYQNSLLLKAYQTFTANTTYNKADARTIIRTFERLLSEKAAADIRDKESPQPPMDFDHFLLSSLVSEENGQQVYCEFIGGLLALVHNGLYPELIARILGLHEQMSTAPAFAATVPHVYSRLLNEFQFVKLQKKVNHQMMEENSEESTEDVLSGGQIPLPNALNSIFESFHKHPATALSWVRLLKPNSISEENYLLYLLCNRIKSVNTDSNKLFKELTSERTVSYSDFVGGLKRKFNLEFTDEEFRLLFDRIDRTHAGALARVGMTQEVKLTWYYDFNSKPDFTLTKVQVLNAYLEVGREYMRSLVWEAYLATKEFRSSSFDYPITSFDSVAQALELVENRDLVLRKILSLSEHPSETHLGLDELVRYVLRRPVGFLGNLLVGKHHTESPVSRPFGDLPDALKFLQEA